MSNNMHRATLPLVQMATAIQNDFDANNVAYFWIKYVS